MSALSNILGVLQLGLLAVVSYLLVVRVFKESCRVTTLVATPAVGAALLLGSCAYSWRFVSVRAGWWLFTLLLGLTLAGLWKLPKGGQDTNTALSVGGRVYLALGSVLVLFYALFGQSTGMVVDGDFFVHVTEIGLFQEGHYPPKNPFLQVPTHGHFGRQILIAALGVSTGLPFLEVEWLYTCGAQLTSFLLLFCLIWRVTQSEAHATLGSGFAFFGANLGNSIGIADTVSNHNPTAVLFWMLGSWLFFRVLHRGTLPLAAAALAGVLLGLDGIVYEIHYGLMILASPFLVWALGGGRSRVKLCSVMVVASLLVATTAGGVLTEMAGRAAGLGGPVQESAAQQKVKISIPKDKLWQVRLDNLRPARPFEGKWRPWSANFEASTEYSSIFSKRLLNVMWYPTWCFPLALAYFFWKGHPVGVWFGILGFGAGLAPSIVDFGFFEGEILRWLFVVAVCSSLCFGLLVAEVCKSVRAFWARGLVLAAVLLMGTVGFRISVSDAVWALRHPGQALPIGRPGIVPGTGLVPRPFSLLRHHFGLTRDSFAVAAWIRENTSQDALVLADDLQADVNARAAFIGLSGRFPAGYLRPDSPTSNPQEYQRAPEVVSFWQTGETKHLAKTAAQIVVARSQTPACDGLETSSEWTEAHRVGEFRIFLPEL